MIRVQCKDIKKKKTNSPGERKSHLEGFSQLVCTTSFEVYTSSADKSLQRTVNPMLGTLEPRDSNKIPGEYCLRGLW
jgi:hypothetical protein